MDIVVGRHQGPPPGENDIIAICTPKAWLRTPGATPQAG
jgi:hypothetical protein